MNEIINFGAILAQNNRWIMGGGGGGTKKQGHKIFFIFIYIHLKYTIFLCVKWPNIEHIHCKTIYI